MTRHSRRGHQENVNSSAQPPTTTNVELALCRHQKRTGQLHEVVTVDGKLNSPQ